jgi:predicted HTH domain antitoxin
LVDPQARYDLVLAHYLAGAISLARAAELLDLSWLELRARCLRLDVPLRTAPADLDQARADVEAAAARTMTPGR